MSLFAFIHFDDIFCVNRESFVRVNHHTKQARIGLEKQIKIMGEILAFASSFGTSGMTRILI